MATDFFKIGQATGQQFVDVSGAVQKGLEAGLKPFAEYEKSRKERTEALGRILQKTPNLAELPKIPAQYSPEISKWAVNAKNEYAAAARTLVQTSADSPEYQAAVEKINRITNAFINLDNQLKGIREERIEYLEDYRNGVVSKGFKNADIELAYSEQGSIANIDINGNVALTGGEGKSFLWNERQEHYNVNPYIQKSMVDLSTNAKSNGLQGISFTQDEYKEQLKAIMADPRIGNIQGLKSLVYDDIDGTALNIAETNPEVLQLLEAETPDLPAIKQKLVDILAPALENVNKTSVNKYNKTLSNSTDPKLTRAQQDKKNENAANKARIDNAYKAAIDAYNQNNLGAGAFERVKTLFGSQVDIVPVDIKRGIFTIKYKSAPTDPDFVSATIDLADNESLATLYDLADIRAGVDYTELPNFQITKPTGPTVPTREETRTTTNPLLQQ